MGLKQYRDKDRRRRYTLAFNARWRREHLAEYRKYNREYYHRKRRAKQHRKRRITNTALMYGYRSYELLAAVLLNARRNPDKRFDLLLGAMNVEVKTRTKSAVKSSWTFRRNPTRADLYVFICLDATEEVKKIYVIPSERFGKAISFSQRSKWDAKYLITAP